MIIGPKPRINLANHGIRGRGLIDTGEKSAEGSAAETEPGDAKVGVADFSGVERVHGANAAVILSSETPSVARAIVSSSDSGPWK